VAVDVGRVVQDGVDVERLAVLAVAVPIAVAIPMAVLAVAVGVMLGVGAAGRRVSRRPMRVLMWVVWVAAHWHSTS
jgi:hypothetical protein